MGREVRNLIIEGFIILYVAMMFLILKMKFLDDLTMSTVSVLWNAKQLSFLLYCFKNTIITIRLCKEHDIV